MATCKENCIHYPVCGISDRLVFLDDNEPIWQEFSSISNVEEYCRYYISNEVLRKLRAYQSIDRLCSQLNKGDELK